MKNILKNITSAFFLSLIFHSVSIPQTNNNLEFFPIHIGDKWQYFTTGWEMYETHTYYRTITVTDEIVMPNNEKYFITDFWPLGYVRVDSLEQTVYVYNDFPVGSNCSNSEIDRFKLFLSDSGAGLTKSCGNINIEYSTNIYFEQIIGDSLQRIRYDFRDHTDFYFKLERGFGVQSWSMSEGVYGSSGYLIAAEINGVIYGEFVGIEDESPTLQEFKLYLAYPNPFNPVTTIHYELPKRSDVKITIYDLLGRKVTTLVNQTQDAGYKSLIWNATNDRGKPVSAGVYLYQITAGDFVQTKKMVLLK